MILQDIRQRLDPNRTQVSSPGRHRNQPPPGVSPIRNECNRDVSPTLGITYQFQCPPNHRQRDAGVTEINLIG